MNERLTSIRASTAADIVNMESKWVMPAIPDSLSQPDWMLMTETITLNIALSEGFMPVFNDEEWLDVWAPAGMAKGYFHSPKGIFIVSRPYFAAINRKKLESLCGTQEVFNRIVPAIMYLAWRVLENHLQK